jgi:carbon starvation protein CstA
MAKNGKFHWIATAPAVFMSAVCSTYILIAPEGLKLSTAIAYPSGIAFALILLVAFLYANYKRPNLEIAAEISK